MRQHKDCNFSYAGLKTQVRLAIESQKMLVDIISHYLLFVKFFAFSSLVRVHIIFLLLFTWKLSLLSCIGETYVFVIIFYINYQPLEVDC